MFRKAVAATIAALAVLLPAKAAFADVFVIDKQNNLCDVIPAGGSDVYVVVSAC